MGLAFVPLSAARPFLPLPVLQVGPEHARPLYSLVLAAVNLSPAVVSAILLSLGTMTLQPFVLSLIPALGEPRLPGTYCGFYYLLQGSAAIAGHLALGVTFDLAPGLGFPSAPWLLLCSLGLVSALSMVALDRRCPREPASAWPALSPRMPSRRFLPDMPGAKRIQ